VNDVDRHHAELEHALFGGRDRGGDRRAGTPGGGDRIAGQVRFGHAQPGQPGAEHAQAEAAALGDDRPVGAHPGQQRGLAVGGGELEPQDVGDEQERQPVVPGGRWPGPVIGRQREQRQAGVGDVVVLAIPLVQGAVEEPPQQVGFRWSRGRGLLGDLSPDAVERC
jgi:hypothetical protein